MLRVAERRRPGRSGVTVRVMRLLIAVCSSLSFQRAMLRRPVQPCCGCVTAALSLTSTLTACGEPNQALAH